MDEQERNEPEVDAEDREDLEVRPEESEDVKGGFGGPGPLGGVGPHG